MRKERNLNKKAKRYMKKIESMPRVLRSFVEMLLNGNEAKRKEGNRFITILTKTKKFF